MLYQNLHSIDAFLSPETEKKGMVGKTDVEGQQNSVYGYSIY